MWFPGVVLCDGIAYDYGQRNKLIVSEHNFDSDILSLAEDISKRFGGNKKRNKAIEETALIIFDAMKKSHGLGKRERLLLRIAVRLHDCGYYIGFNNVGINAYGTVMANEIIGLSPTERNIVAGTVRFMYEKFGGREGVWRRIMEDESTYVMIAKLTAILRLAEGLNRGKSPKARVIKADIKNDRLEIDIETKEDISLEKGLMTGRSELFSEVFSTIPVIKRKMPF